MPKKQASSSSSSEDLAAFQSVAVTFEEITSQQRQVAEQAKQRISGSAKRKRSTSKKHDGPRGDGDAAGEQDSGGESDDQPIDQLNPVQLKIAVALDTLLEGRLRLRDPGPKRRRRETRAAERAEAAERAGGFRFFATVPPGTAVVLEQPESEPLSGTPFPETFRQRRQPDPDEAAAALPALAVDGTALVAAATAAAGNAVESSLGKNGAQGNGSGGGSAASRKQKQPPPRNLGSGVVVDPRVFVPHDERMLRLVGCPG